MPRVKKTDTEMAADQGAAGETPRPDRPDELLGAAAGDDAGALEGSPLAPDARTSVLGAADSSVTDTGTDAGAAGGDAGSEDAPGREAEAGAEAAEAEAGAEAAEAEAGEEGAAVDPDRKWYVIHTYSGYEAKVKANLEKRVASMLMQDKIFRVVVPTEDEIEYKDGRKIITKKKVFPGYVLVEMIMNDDSWYVVRNTPGVTGFVGSGAKPVALDASEVRRILRHMGMDEPRPKVMYEEGESVKVVSGPFMGFIGKVREVNLDKGKLRVFVSMFGRETPVELDFSQVEKL